jgi:hypothetical protein
VTTSALDTEFGRALVPMMEVPGALGAILSDDRGYPVDYVRDPEQLSELDVQILGAQLGQALAQLSATTKHRGLREPIVLLEADERAVVAGLVWEGYALALLLRHPANVALALQCFGEGRARLDALLGG